MLTFDLDDDAIVAAMSEETTQSVQPEGLYVLESPITVKGHEPFTELRLREPVVFDVLMQAKANGKRVTEEGIYDGQIALVARVSGWPLLAVNALPASVLDDAIGYVAGFEEDARRKPDDEADRTAEKVFRLDRPVEAVNRTWHELRLREPTVAERRRFKADEARQTQEAFFQSEINLMAAVSGWQMAAVLKMPISVFAKASDYLTGFFIAGPTPGSRFRAS